GFMQIEGWSFLDSLYMTVITLTTIGYHEVQALSDTGKVFNLVLIMFGVGTVTFSITKIISDITSIDFRTRRREKMKKKIESMSGHTIVCGYGRMGEVICKRLAEYNIDFVVIERDPGLIEELNKSNYLHIDGDAANDDHMLEAGIERAKSLVSVIDNDSDGLYIALAARSINPHLFIIVRANEEKARKRILRAGANKVILPFVMSGNKVADTVINPATEDLFDITSAKECDPKEKIELADLIVRESSTITGKTLNEVGPLMPNLLIIGIKNDDEGFEFKPGSTHVFQAGECLIAMGPRKDYENAKAVLNLG
ncbi:MAG: potassium channel family protein, partial [Flavobacteriaceae bacterium]|nr:potassium channel family protein [Flavobacteriaceae bacterium]